MCGILLSRLQALYSVHAVLFLNFNSRVALLNRDLVQEQAQLGDAVPPRGHQHVHVNEVLVPKLDRVRCPVLKLHTAVSFQEFLKLL